MSLNVRIDELFDEPAEKVWLAITDSKALADWLMPNDFEPQVGKKFTLFPDHETPWEGNVDCEVVELSPPRRMVWTWQTHGMARPSKVVFELVPRDAGTELRLRHTGEADEPLSRGLTDGWPLRLGELRTKVKGPPG